jgi:hypothetical protein
VGDAGVHRRLQQRADHQHRIHHHQVHAALTRRLPRRLLRYRLPVAVPVLMNNKRSIGHPLELDESRRFYYV